jgi:AraC family transcriptional regulator, exoenzyme S synthesis regulatory protein ExsA
MGIFNLPQDIFKNGKTKNEEIIFHHYHAPIQSFKGKSMLHKNAISMVISGTKTIQFANASVTVNDNEFHFLSVGNCIVTMDLPKGKSFESVLIFFDDKILAEFLAKYKARITELRKKSKIDQESYIGFTKDDFVRNFIISLKLLIQSAAEVSLEMKRLKFEELMLHLLETSPHKLLAFPVSKNRDLEDYEIKKAVEASITKNTTLEELAFLCNLSLSTFKRRFMTLYGVPPSTWMLQQRMVMAQQLIQQEGYKPSEVYYKVGYENHSSFSQSFKQYFGVTPKEYQRQKI